MLLQPLQTQPLFLKSPKKNDISVRTLLLDAVHENHLLYEMEKRDRPNNTIRLLVSLHELEGKHGKKKKR
jgi:hypothetical protein